MRETFRGLRRRATRFAKRGFRSKTRCGIAPACRLQAATPSNHNAWRCDQIARFARAAKAAPIRPASDLRFHHTPATSAPAEYARTSSTSPTDRAKTWGPTSSEINDQIKRWPKISERLGGASCFRSPIHLCSPRISGSAAGMRSRSLKCSRRNGHSQAGAISQRLTP